MLYDNQPPTIFRKNLLPHLWDCRTHRIVWVGECQKGFFFSFQKLPFVRSAEGNQASLVYVHPGAVCKPRRPLRTFLRRWIFLHSFLPLDHMSIIVQSFLRDFVYIFCLCVQSYDEVDIWPGLHSMPPDFKPPQEFIIVCGACSQLFFSSALLAPPSRLFSAKNVFPELPLEAKFVL